MTAEKAVCTETRDEASTVSFPNRAANMPSSAAGGVLAAMTSTTVSPDGRFSSRQSPSAASGSTTSRRIILTHAPRPCSATRKFACES